MINLLPTEYQKLIRDIYRRRLASVILLALSVLLLASTVILLPSYIIFKSQASAALSRLGEFSEEDKRVTDEGLSQIASFKTQLAKIFPAAVQRVFLTNRLESILNIRPRGLMISDLTVTGKKDFSLRGVAKTRHDIISFVDGLESLTDIKEVNSPVSNLIAERDGTFVITFSFKD